MVEIENLTVAELRQLETDDFRSLLGDLVNHGIDDKTDTYVDAVRDKASSTQFQTDYAGQPKFAVLSAVSSINKQDHMQPATQKVRLYTLGYDSLPPGFGDSRAATFYGVAVPDDEPVGKIVIVVTEDELNGQSMDDVIDLFTGEAYTAIDAEISITDNTKVSGSYQAEVVDRDPDDESIFQTVDDPDREFGERKEIVEGQVEQAEILNISQSISLEQDDSPFPADFGLDLRMIDQASPLQSNVSGNGTRYVFQDNSYIEATDLPEYVRGDENEAGLVCWSEPESMHIDESGWVRLFGIVEESTTGDTPGRIEMRVVGYEPLANVEQIDVPDSNSGGDDNGGDFAEPDTATNHQAVGDPIDETTI